MSFSSRSTHSAFSLFEALLSIVILGVIGIICSSMLLSISKNLAYTRALSDTSPRLALLKIENLLQYAIIDSITADNGAPPHSPTSTLLFATFSQPLLFGGGVKNTTQSLDGDTLLPNASLLIESHYDDTFTFTQLKGWQSGQEVYLFTQPKEPFKIYHIAQVYTNALRLDDKPTHPPRLILPIRSHRLALHDNTLMLNSAPLIFDVLSFTATSINLPQGTFLELHLCIKAPVKAHCESGGVWLDDMIEVLP